MEFTKRKTFLLLLGACGVTLIILANLFEFGSTHEIFLVAANFHNSSLSYLTSLNLNLDVFSKNNKRAPNSLVSEGLKNNLDDFLLRNPNFNVTDITNRYKKKLNTSISREDDSVYRPFKEISVSGRTKVTHSDIGNRNTIKARVNKTSVTYFDTVMKVGEESGAINSQTDDRGLSKFQVNNSYLETRRNNGIKTNYIPGKSQSENKSNNDINLNDTKQILDQNIAKLNHRTKVSKRVKDALKERLLYENRPAYWREHQRDIKQPDDENDNVQDSIDTEIIREEVVLPEKDARKFYKAVNNVYNLPKRKDEVVRRNDRPDVIQYKIPSEQHANELQNAVQMVTQRDELDQTGETQNNQQNKDKIPPEILQKYMANNEQINGDENNNGDQSNDNKEGRGIFNEIPQDFNNIVPQNNQNSIYHKIFHQGKDELDHRPVESHPDQDGFKTDYGVSVLEGFSVDPTCSKGETSVEDILCMKRPQFLPNFRNPCWYQHGVLRCLPYFHIIGVCKTGTTDLFERLSHHPQILKNRGILGKETWYWTWKRYGHSNFYKSYTNKMTLNEFIDQFEAQAIESYTKMLPNGTLYHPAVTGHGDPMDFWDQSSWRQIPQNNLTADIPVLTTPSLIKHVNPNIRLILILRDPIERLFSNYLHGQFGSTAEKFHRDVVLSRALLKTCTVNRSMKSCLYDKNIIRTLRVPISGSFYSVHIKEWLKVFPRKQIFITKTETFAKSVANTLLGIFRFLHLDPLPTRDLYRIANMPHYYNTKAKETSGSIKPETRDILRVMFEPYNIELARILKDEKFNFNNVS